MPAGKKKGRRSQASYNIGTQGRATGITLAEIERDDDGLGNVNDFFESESSDRDIDEDDFDDQVDFDEGDPDELESPAVAPPSSIRESVRSSSRRASAVRSSTRASSAKKSKKTPPQSTPKKKIVFSPEQAANTPEFASLDENFPDETNTEDDEALPTPKSQKTTTKKAAAKSAKASKPKSANPNKVAAKKKTAAKQRLPTVKFDPARTPAFEKGEDGIRRSRRNRLTPCAYWKNERVVYEHAGDGVFKAAGKEKPETPAQTVRNVKRKRSVKSDVSRKAAKSARQSTFKAIPEEPESEDDEEDDATAAEPIAEIPVLDWRPTDSASDEPETFDLLVAKSRAMMKLKSVPVPGSEPTCMQMCKAFHFSEERWASGLLEIAARGQKPKQFTKSNFLVFFVTSGVIEAKIHQSSLNLSKGSMFFVPPNNFYSLVNPGRQSCKLSFMQIKV